MPKILRFTGMFVLGLTVAVSFYFQGLFFQQEQHIFELILAVAFGLWWTGFRLEQHRIAFLSNWMELSMLAILLLYVVTSFTAIFPQGHVNTILQWIGGILLFYAVREECKLDNRWSTWFSWMLVAAGAGVALLGLAGYVGIDVGLKADDWMSDKARYASTFEYANTYAIYAVAMWVVLIGLSLSVKKKLLMLPIAGIVGFLYCVTFLLAASRGSFLMLPVALVGLIIALPKGKRIAGVTFFIGIMLVGFLTVKGVSGNAALSDWGRVWKWLLVGCAAGAVGGAGIYMWLILQRRWRIIMSSTIVVVVIVIGSTAFAKAASLTDQLASKQLQRFTKLSLEEASIFLRLEFDRDALQIVADNPLIGSGGDGWSRLYHEYQRFYYIANVTHDHFLQIAVEIGIAGLLLFVFFWASLVLSLHKQAPASMSRILTVAALIIGVHAVIDFDLSFYSMLLLIFLVAGITSAQVPPLRWSTDRLQISGVVLAALLLLLAAPQAIGDLYLQAGKDKLDQGDKAAAAMHLTKAAALLPLDPQPRVQLARAKIGTGEQLTLLLEAQQLDPNNADWRHELSLALGYYERWKEAYRESAAAIQLAPAKLDYYESTLDFGVQSVIDGFLKDGTINKESVAINAQIAGYMAEYQQSAEEFKQYLTSSTRNTSSTLLSLRAGQALALAGKYEEAVPFFKQSKKTNTLIPESDIWLYLTYGQLHDEAGQKGLANRPWILILPSNPLAMILEKARGL